MSSYAGGYLGVFAGGYLGAVAAKGGGLAGGALPFIPDLFHRNRAMEAALFAYGCGLMR